MLFMLRKNKRIKQLLIMIVKFSICTTAPFVLSHVSCYSLGNRNVAAWEATLPGGKKVDE
jgi:hypothetical protein